MGLSSWDFLATQYTKLPIIPTPSSINGGVYIVTGGNHGLGLECVKHLVRLTASRVIFSSRSLTNGQQALAQIEKDTGIKGVAEVWQLDLSNFDSVRAFADKVNGLDRVDALIENASIALDTWSVAEGLEMTVAVNVAGTFLLGLLVFPKLVESGKRHGITPHLTVVGSSTAFDCAGVLENIDGDILDGLNIEAKGLAGRYPLTKLLQLYVVRQLASLLPYDKTRVVININCPGLCNTGLARHTSWKTRLQIRTFNMLVGRTPEMGSRTLLHAAAAGPESHGKFCQSCAVREDFVDDWITNQSGHNVQVRVWDSLARKLQEVDPGCVSRALESGR